MTAGVNRAVVVGAGVSGLTCARSLLSAGWDVTVVDKARGLGGRLSSRRVDQVGSFDLGAQFMTARDPRFSQFLAAQKDLGHADLWTGTIVYITDEGMMPARKERRWVGQPGMNRWVRDMVPPDRIRHGETVQRMEWHGERGWSLDGSWNETFDWVILALPAPQAAALLPAEHGLRDLCAAVSLEPCWTVYAAFSGSLGIPFDGAFVRDPSKALSWVANGSSKLGRSASPDLELWVLQASASWSRQHFETPAADVQTRLLAELMAYASAGKDKAQTVYVGSHRWRYASLRDDAEAMGSPLIDWDKKLGVTGDWVHAGRVEGAYLAGLDLGERMARGR